jgi:F0F1-type ATP synthase assembly protein I
MSDRKKRFAADSRFYRGAMRWMGVGFEFLIVIGLFVGGGYWLDELEGTRPGWMILGFFVGFGVMLYIMIQRARKDSAQEEAEKKSEWEAELKAEDRPREP